MPRGLSIYFDTFLVGSLTGLILPPFVNLLFAHIKICSIFVPQLFDAFTGPHKVLLALGSENFELPSGLALSLTVKFYEFIFCLFCFLLYLQLFNLVWDFFIFSETSPLFSNFKQEFYAI